MCDNQFTIARSTGNGFDVICPCCGCGWHTGNHVDHVKLCPRCGLRLESTREYVIHAKPKHDRPPQVFVVPKGTIPPEDFDPDYDAMVRPYNQRDRS